MTTRSAIVPVLLFLVAACTPACTPTGPIHPGWLMEASADGSRAGLLSERFEYADRILADRVGMLFSITLGPDRLPAGWRASPGPGVVDGRIVDRSGRIIEEVYEMVFLNLTDETINFSPRELRLRTEERVRLRPETITLAPGASAAIEPFVRIGSVYQPREHDFRFTFEDRGVERWIVDTADRLSVEEWLTLQNIGLAWRFKPDRSGR